MEGAFHTPKPLSKFVVPVWSCEIMASLVKKEMTRIINNYLEIYIEGVSTQVEHYWDWITIMSNKL